MSENGRRHVEHLIHYLMVRNTNSRCLLTGIFYLYESIDI